MQMKLSVLVMITSVTWSACQKPRGEQASPGQGAAASAAALAAATPLGRRSLLMSQAQFTWTVDDQGKRKPEPGPAQLVILTPDQGQWRSQILEDADSRVFHKAMCWQPPAQAGMPDEKTLVTFGATQAYLKTWTWRDNRWQGVSRWNPRFGGQWDRLRDAEHADVDGDGQAEFVVGTHDQGVIAVVKPKAGTWEVREIFRQANTFIHEIEVGDVDGDGKKEIYATPSQPNKADRSQGGSILVFRRQGNEFRAETVEVFKRRHAKEILVTDINGDGRDELFASIEAETETVGDKMIIRQPLEIRRYAPDGKGWKAEIVASLADGVQARVLLAGEVRQAGKKELVVTTMRDGIWLLTPPLSSKEPWQRLAVDKDSSGFEHAATLADIDGDGRPELYVAADDQDRVRRYSWTGQTFSREDIFALEPNDLTWSIEPCL